MFLTRKRGDKRQDIGCVANVCKWNSNLSNYVMNNPLLLCFLNFFLVPDLLSFEMKNVKLTGRHERPGWERGLGDMDGRGDMEDWDGRHGRPRWKTGVGRLVGDMEDMDGR